MSGILTTLAGHQFHMTSGYKLEMIVFGIFINNYIICNRIAVFKSTCPETAINVLKFNI